MKQIKDFTENTLRKYVVASPDVDGELVLNYFQTLYECLDFMLEVSDIDIFEFINNSDFNSTDEFLNEIEIIPLNDDNERFFIFESGDDIANVFKNGDTLSDFFDAYNDVSFNEWLKNLQK